MEYPKNRWFIKHNKEKTFEENIRINNEGMLMKMKFINELEVWYGEKFIPLAEASMGLALSGGGWIKKNTEIKKDAKDLKGKKFKIKIIETIIRRTDSNWLKDD